MSFPERSLDLQPSSTFTEAGSSGAVDGSFVKGATAGWEALPYSEDSAHNRQKAAGGHHAYLGSSLIFMSGAKVGEILRKHSPASQPTIHQLADFLEAWESEPGALQQLTTHQYDSTLLPDYDLALCYVEAYFKCIQCAFPVVDYPSFMERFKHTYPVDDPRKESAWCSLVNVILAVGCRSLWQQNNGSAVQEAQFCGLFRNAISLFPAIVIETISLSGTQALAIMFLFLSCSAAVHCGWMLLSNAIRMAQALGLHKQPCKSWGLKGDEIRERNVLFWCLFCFDINMAFWSGRPPQISLSDVTIPPPHTFRGDFAMVDIYEGRSQVGCDAEHEVHLHELFMKMIETCKLITEVNQWIRLEPSDSSLLATALKLDADLSTVYHSLRPAWQFCDTVNVVDMTSTPPQLLPSLVQIHLLILNARWVIFARLDNFRTAIRPSLPDDISGYNAASLAIELVHALPAKHMGGSWLFDLYAVQAFWVLFIATINHPTAPEQDHYLSQMSSVVEATADGATGDALISTSFLTRFMMLYCRVARLVVRQANSSGSEVIMVT